MSLAIIYELRANDIKEEDIELIMSRIKNRLSEENIDKELVKLGYPKIFTVDYDDYDNFDYTEDDFTPNSKGHYDDE
ncbi:hypothetical protein AAX26_00366 [Aliarcobacter thereius]|uniref:Uncharacterized protein n=2 Tax=Aliarcobacter thereius TaxID=544718 RepID=A0A1C0B9A7_9BACT|nr:hypothetical protein [Aliarcobacter thereius]OCL88680.1 hypothetical protein AAX26_00366 [Aliarcobacter thereius]OCL92175.1 hypothetical protein AAX25_00905 [Aliarcobacter thereius]OCL94729.1 hypothetical protein AA347_00168 [Aliarcobacter thereius LMG 24486]OCM00175.1 hypothetical protein AAX29_00173 [Aliarcobacter thereius]QBF15395.1 hypothetical protein ATH_0305 [Aliarcobacter thereius LMG 24486]